MNAKSCILFFITLKTAFKTPQGSKGQTGIDSCFDNRASCWALCVFKYILKCGWKVEVSVGSGKIPHIIKSQQKYTF